MRLSSDPDRSGLPGASPVSYTHLVGANCTMMHMLLGVDALSIGKSPYAPMFVKAKDIEAEEIGIHAVSYTHLHNTNNCFFLRLIVCIFQMRCV